MAELTDRITFVGHATTVIEQAGTRLLTDPVLRDSVLHLRRRAAPIDPAAVEAIDAVLISHADQDHLDLPSLKRLPDGTPVVVPAGLGRLVRHAGLRDVRELRAGERTEIGGVEIVATAANHTAGRPPFGYPRADPLGYLTIAETVVYFAGDTDLFDEMAAIHDSIDLALIPIWGWGPRRGLHLFPETAPDALEMIRPRIVVPIHWGTFASVGVNHPGGRELREPADEFRQLAKIRTPDVDVRVLDPGEATEFGPAPTANVPRDPGGLQRSSQH